MNPLNGTTWNALRSHSVQSAVWRDPELFKVVCAGRGSGKSEIARRYVVRWLPIIKDWPDPKYFYALPTYNQAKRVAWHIIKRLVPPRWLAGTPSESELIIKTIFGSELHIVGMDKPQRIEGTQWDGGVLDECSDQKPGIWDKSLMPAFSHRNAWGWRIGVPKRNGVGATEFEKAFRLGQTANNLGIKSYTWKSADIVNADVIARARETLAAIDFAEQFEASWEKAGGRVFDSFDSRYNVTDAIDYDPNKTIYVGSDFNVDPMSWTLCHRVDKGLHAFDEIWLRNTTTRNTLSTLYERYMKHSGGWVFTGDATGAARKTSAAESDYIQIQNDDRFSPKRVAYPKSNPAKLDRFAACNGMFCNAKNERRLTVHPRCEHLIDDLERRSFKENSRETDDRGDISHMSDALGYVVYALFPLRVTTIGSEHAEVTSA